MPLTDLPFIRHLSHEGKSYNYQCNTKILIPLVYGEGLQAQKICCVTYIDFLKLTFQLELVVSRYMHCQMAPRYTLV